MNSTDYEEVQLDEKTYKQAEKCAKKLGLTVDEFVNKAICMQGQLLRMRGWEKGGAKP